MNTMGPIAKRLDSIADLMNVGGSNYVPLVSHADILMNAIKKRGFDAKYLAVGDVFLVIKQKNAQAPAVVVQEED